MMALFILVHLRSSFPNSVWERTTGNSVSRRVVVTRGTDAKRSFAECVPKRSLGTRKTRKTRKRESMRAGSAGNTHHVSRNALPTLPSAATAARVAKRYQQYHRKRDSAKRLRPPGSLIVRCSRVGARWKRAPTALAHGGAVVLFMLRCALEQTVSLFSPNRRAAVRWVCNNR